MPATLTNRWETTSLTSPDGAFWLDLVYSPTSVLRTPGDFAAFAAAGVTDDPFILPSAEAASAAVVADPGFVASDPAPLPTEPLPTIADPNFVLPELLPLPADPPPTLVGAAGASSALTDEEIAQAFSALTSQAATAPSVIADPDFVFDVPPSEPTDPLLPVADPDFVLPDVPDQPAERTWRIVEPDAPTDPSAFMAWLDDQLLV